jgi:hypothetical protein
LRFTNLTTHFHLLRVTNIVPQQGASAERESRRSMERTREEVEKFAAMLKEDAGD